MSQNNGVENNKRIAKNTLFLYFRMLLTMAVSLFTVKIILKTLGTVDYGIYNVVGSIVVIFSFLSGTMSSASQRFFSFEIGQGNQERLNRTFSITMIIYAGLTLSIILFAETIGLWFLNTKMVIPMDRMPAARFIYQLSILTLALNMLTVPYNSVILAHEKMKIYAYVSIVDVCLKLLVVYVLMLFSFDKLELYGILILLVTLIISSIYRIYCKRRFEECKFRFIWDKRMFNDILSYSGWSLFGALSSVAKNHGINLLLNLSFGPIVNAARGVAYQVQSVVQNLGNNFFAAVRPQIIKSYASNDQIKLISLLNSSTKFSFYLILILTLPILLETPFILSVWLNEIPNYTVVFIRLIIIDTVLELLANPLITLVQATGKIKYYQIIVGGVRLLILPISFLFLQYGFEAESVFYVSVFNTLLCLFLRIVMIKKIIEFDVMAYLRQVIFVIFLVAFSSFIIPFLISTYWGETSILKSITIITTCSISTVLSVLFIGLKKSERAFILTFINKKVFSRI